jgi:hypothetical protein
LGDAYADTTRVSSAIERHWDRHREALDDARGPDYK